MHSRTPKLAKRFTVEMSVSLIRHAIESRSHAFIIALLESSANIRGHNTLLHTTITTYVKAIQEAPLDRYVSLWHEGEQVIRLLVDAGVNINSIDDKGQTALHLAAKHNGILEDVLLMLGADTNITDNDGVFILEQGIPDIQRLEKYIAAGASARNTNLWNETILHRLVFYGIGNRLNYHDYTSMMRLLLLYGADINAADIDGRTTLQLAAMNGCIDIVRAILNLRVASIYDAADYRGESPVEIQSDFTELERTQINIAVKVNLDHQDNMGRTALMDSVCKRISALLIVFGANVQLADELGETALDVVDKINDNNTKTLLFRAGARASYSASYGSLFYEMGRQQSSPVKSVDKRDVDDECVFPQPK